MGQTLQKHQIQDLLNKVHPKGQIFKMTLLSPIDLDEIKPCSKKIGINYRKSKIVIRMSDFGDSNADNAEYI